MIPEVRTFDVAAIKPNPYQPQSRLEVAGEVIERFARSIEEHGLLQLPVVRMIDQGQNVQMADGWMRLLGHCWLVNHGLKQYREITCQVREITDRQMADMILEANAVRQDLTAIDKAQFYKRYLGDFKVTQAELARAHNISQGELSNTLRLLELDPVIQHRIISQEITPTHARYLVQLRDPLQQSLLAQEIVSKGLSVAALDERIKDLTGKEKKTVPAPKTPAVSESESPRKELGNESESPRKELGNSSETAPVQEPPAPVTEEPAATVPTPEEGEAVLDEDVELEDTTDEESAREPGTPKATAPKTAIAKPAATPAPIPIPVPASAQGRKIVFEETGALVRVTTVIPGKIPTLKVIKGSLRDALSEILKKEETT